ncbi:MAG: substrate-binding domain-containing protein [Rikenellaceae bacterium]
MMSGYIIIVAVMLSSLVGGCSDDTSKFVVGVSQHKGGVRSQQLLRELEREALFYGDIELRSVNARNSSQRQAQQIMQFMDDGVDLLIITPNDADTVGKMVDLAAERNIPTVLTDRVTNSKKHTASITANNFEIGEAAANYIVERLSGGGRVLELGGADHITSNREIHRGFRRVISKYPNIKRNTIINIGREQEDAVRTVDSVIVCGEQFDVVFAHNDFIAYGAYLAAERHNINDKIIFIGVGGLNGNSQQGLRLVVNGILEASFSQPTTGDVVMKTTHNILTGQTFKRNKRQSAEMLTKANATLAILNEKQAEMLDYRIDNLKGRLTQSEEQSLVERYKSFIILIVAIVVILLLLLYLRYLKLNAPTIATLESVNTSVEVDSDDRYTAEEREFLNRFMGMVRGNVSNSDFGVDDMYEEMGLSRVQLFRTVKRLTEMSPNEILRLERLKQGDELLRTTSKTIAEIAYAVGYTAPSYFSKCYKEQFGLSPTEVR